MLISEELGVLFTGLRGAFWNFSFWNVAGRCKMHFVLGGGPLTVFSLEVLMEITRLHAENGLDWGDFGNDDMGFFDGRIWLLGAESSFHISLGANCS